MISPDILRQVRRIEIYTNRVVNETMAGRYESTFKGRGVEFDAVREYQPGDDIRSIDWNVTARTGRPHIKRYVEERELTVIFMVDLSRSMAFGSVRQLKGQLATELCAVLAFSAIKNHDKVGLLLFTEHIEHFIPPKKGATHVLRVIEAVLAFQPRGHGTDIARALEYVSRVIHRHAVVFLISDFFGTELARPLRIANRRHDLIALHLVDPRQEQLPRLSWLQLDDAETGQLLLLDAANPRVRQQYAQWAQAHAADVRATLQAAGVDLMTVRTDQSYREPLLRFFRLRALRH